MAAAVVLAGGDDEVVVAIFLDVIFLRLFLSLLVDCFSNDVFDAVVVAAAGAVVDVDDDVAGSTILLQF